MVQWRDATDDDVRASVPIPVQEARAIADAFSKRIVVVLALDANCVLHTTTYGVEVDDKMQAARLGEHVAVAVLGSNLTRGVLYEDYRLEAANSVIGRLRAALQWALIEIGPDHHEDDCPGIDNVRVPPRVRRPGARDRHG